MKLSARHISILIASTASAFLTPLHSATLYTSRSLWESDTPGFSTLTFESFGGSGHVGDFSQSGIFFDAKATYGTDDYLFSGGPGSGYDIGSGNYMFGGFSIPGQYTRYLEASVPSTYDSFGLDVSTYGGAGFISVMAATSLGNFQQIVATPSAGRAFVGFTLDDAETLSYLRVENVATAGGGTGNDNYLFDNFSFGEKSSASVPDSGTSISLLGLAFVGLAALRTRFNADDRRVTEAVR